jgi:hypothetical protein
MEKRGQGLPVSTIILIVLGLVVLVILILVVRQQVTRGASRYEEIGKEVEIRADKCYNIIEQRSCAKSCPEGYRPVSGTWSDCKSGEVCCQKKET